MHTTTLRKVGGSVMLAVPPDLLDLLHLQVGVSVGIAVTEGRLVIEPPQKPRYTLGELLAQWEGVVTGEEQEWLDGGPVGRELL